MNKIRCSEEGSILLSTFHLLLFISFLILSFTSIIKHQVMQLQQISYSYEAKAMIEISEAMLRNRSDLLGVENAVIYFNEGRVDIRKETETLYSFVAKLPNHYTSQLNISIIQPEGSENSEVQDNENTEIQDSENFEVLNTDKAGPPDLSSDGDKNEKVIPLPDEEFKE